MKHGKHYGKHYSFNIQYISARDIMLSSVKIQYLFNPYHIPQVKDTQDQKEFACESERT